MHYVDVACRFTIALVFVVSAASKLRAGADLDTFARSLRLFRLLPARWVRPVAVAVVLGELVVPPLVLVPATAPAGFLVAVVLLAVFSAAIAWVIRNGEVVTCRCFGPSDIPFSRRHLVRNGLLLVVALTGVASFGGPLHLGGGALAGLSGVAGGLILINFDEIVDLFAAPAGRRDRSS